MSTELNSDASAELADPGTSPERLQQLAAAHPGLGPRIAEHPNCYPELRQWIAQQHPGVQEPGRRRGALKILGIAAAIALPLITAATVTITVLANMNERASSIDTLAAVAAPDSFSDAAVIGEVNQPPGGDGNIDWYIPASAPFESFPLDAAPGPNGQTSGCSENELAWLREHARPSDYVSSFSLTLHNNSTVGASMPIGNIRFIGEEVSSEPFVSFQCPAGGRGATGGGQPLLIRTDGEEALYGEAVGVSGDDVMPEGSPVTLNLSPGEVSVITLTRDPSVDTQRRYEGSFVADLLDDSGETIVLAEEVVFRRAPVEGFYIGYESGMLSDTFVCSSPGVLGELDQWGHLRPVPCSIAEAVETLQRAKAETGE